MYQSSSTSFAVPDAVTMVLSPVPSDGSVRVQRSYVEAWATFAARYERFTDLLCAAAKNGCDSSVESEYDRLRRWFLDHYDRVAACLRPYLTQEEDGPQSDLFESMLRSSTLQSLLRCDNGELIARVSQISAAVYRCDADLSGAGSRM
jgi:hypothetical protein